MLFRSLVEYNKDSARFRVALRGVGKPTIAMIRGWCLGGGLAVALNCDMRICTEDSQFGVPAARLGIGYGAESLGQLVELCGPAVTKELMFTARRYTAAEALRIGLVNQVVQANMLEDFVHSYAATMVDNAPLSIVAAKRIIDARSKIVMPGGIDPHVHLKWYSPHPDGSVTYTDGPEVVGRAALFGGTTTMIEIGRAHV